MTVIEAEGVRKSYGLGSQSVEVLHGIDLQISTGEFVAIVGPSGSGKTTCLEILGCLTLPSAGRFRFDGHFVDTLDDDARSDLRARRIGFVFQNFNLMPRMSAVRNVALPLVYQGIRRADRERRAADLLARLGLGHRLNHRPGELSGGERQRVAIARALINDPAVVLADEPTGSLDQETGREVLDLLATLRGGERTLIVVTHSDEVAQRADRVLTLRDGLVSEQSTGRLAGSGVR